MAKIAVEHVFGSETVPLVNLEEPSNVLVTNFGTPGATTYTYYVSAYNARGETLTTTAATTTGNATLSASNFNRITWDKVWGATGYYVYNSSGAWSPTSNLHFDDTGASPSARSQQIENTTGYNSLYTSVGTLMYQSGGAIGPIPVKVARPFEESTAFQTAYPSVIPWSPAIDWVFVIEPQSASPTSRRVMLYEFNRSTDAFTWKGYITISFPTGSTNHVVRGFAMTYDVYSTGTVSVSGTAVTGSGTTWTTDRIAVGSRIGFGSTDPNQISTWYEISQILSDTSITLTATAGTINANEVYCVEELRAVITTTNATTTNGGLFLSKGLKYEIFVSGGTNISNGSVTDNLRATYWLADASTVTNTAACGNAVDSREDWNTQYCYIVDGTGPSKVYKYNLRASLTGLSSGKSTSAFVLATGNQAVTGAGSQANNGEVVAVNHGVGKNVNSLYFVTSARVYRAAINNITNGNTLWISDCMVEIPPGSTNTFTSQSSFGYIEHADFIDRFVEYSTGSFGIRGYVTQYDTFVGAFNSILGIESKQLDQVAADSNSVPHPSVNSAQLSSWNEKGMHYVSRGTGVNTTNQLYAVPLSACYTHEWQEGCEQYVITPAMPTPNGATVYRAYVNAQLAHGGTDAFMIEAEPVKIWYRTEGIHDNAGVWILLPDNGDLTGVKTSKDIQFRLAFKVIGMYQLPSKVYSVCVVYDTDGELPSHLQWNMGDTNSSTGIVGFIQKGTYGSVPNLQISYYRTDSDELILTQASTGSTYGAFEYWNGSSWASGLGTDTDGIRRRFNPTIGILTGINVYCKLKVV